MARYPIRREAGQGVDEMAAQLMESSGRNKLNKSAYPEASAEVRRKTLRDVITQQRDLLKKSKERGRRIDLNSLEEVERCADDYLESCIRANCIPSMLGFAACTGYSRMSIYRYIHEHTTESARFLDNLRSSWAAIMAQMALSRQASEPTAIFLLKNSGQDLNDRVDITATAMPYEDRPKLTAEEIVQRYSYARVDDDEEPGIGITDDQYTEGSQDDELEKPFY